MLALYERSAGWYCRQIELHLNIQLKDVVVVVPVAHISNSVFSLYIDICICMHKYMYIYIDKNTQIFSPCPGQGDASSLNSLN